MQTVDVSAATDVGVLAPAPDVDAVAELMAPEETLLGRPTTTLPQGGDAMVLLAVLLASPVDEPEDD